MTIDKGRPWGTSIEVPGTFQVAESDVDLARIDRSTPVVVTGGDVHRAIGEPHGVSPGQSRTLVEVDALICSVTSSRGRHDHVVASSIEIGGWMPFRVRSGRYICVTNAGVVRGRDVAPRGHPNDGRFDVMTIDPPMPRIQRLISLRRARTGDHVPHPDITISRSTVIDFTRAYRRERLSLDGQRIRDWTRVDITIVPDYWRVIV